MQPNLIQCKILVFKKVVMLVNINSQQIIATVKIKHNFCIIMEYVTYNMTHLLFLVPF